MTNPYKTGNNCCPLFDPATLDEKELCWDNKLFIKEKVKCLFGIPLNFGAVMLRCMQKIEAADAYTPKPPMILCHHSSSLKMDVYIEIPREVPGTETVGLSGEFFCKVYDGPYNGVVVWAKEMKKLMTTKGKSIVRQFYYYTCCPKCAKQYGKNYIVLIAQTK